MCAAMVNKKYSMEGSLGMELKTYNISFPLCNYDMVTSGVNLRFGLYLLKFSFVCGKGIQKEGSCCFALTAFFLHIQEITCFLSDITASLC